MCYAHSLEGRPEEEWQSLENHLQNTGNQAERFAEKFGAGPLGKAVGLLHDIGKGSKDFQDRLRGKPIRVDHSTPGAQAAIRIYGKAYGRLLAYVIAGHHTGLPDYGSLGDGDSLCRRLNTPLNSNFSNSISESNLPKLQTIPFKTLPNNPGFSFQFFIRVLYSCLVDADFLDTEAFLNPDKSSARGVHGDILKLNQKLDADLDGLAQKAPKTAVNVKRKQILEYCQERATLSPGLFTLTVPTGGGKTLTSLSFALKHALENGMERVIYIIPYTSIIEQNADVFRRIVGQDNVLEHHSNYRYVEPEDENWTPEHYRLNLATENWDAPIVVSTNVQFFESLFGYRSSRCRKLHNITNSVIIIDEAQMLPKSFLKPCLLALAELTQNYNCSVVLCTATQPAIHKFLPKNIKPVELAPDPPELYETFRRVKVTQLGSLEDQSLANKIIKHNQVLCIVNTRKHAAKIFELIKGKNVFHLSALMYPNHRSRKLRNIREALKSSKQCKVISTQLIEAGVDVDFPVVYRAISGIDSISQAAGRCNREGHLARGDVFLFKPERHGQPSGWFQETAAVAEIVMRKHQDPLTLEAVKEYFDQLFDFEGDRLDKYGLLNMFEERSQELAFPFRKVADRFKVIDQETIAIIIPIENECQEILEEVRWRGPNLKSSRALQHFTVQVYHHEFHRLLQARVLENIAGQYLVLKDSTLYDKDRGLVLDGLPTSNDILVI